MTEILLRRQAGDGADHEIFGREAERLAAPGAIVAAGIEAVEVDSIGNHDQLLRPASKQLALRENQVADSSRFANDSLAWRLVGNPARQIRTVEAFDDRPDAGVLRGYDPVPPRVQQAYVDRVGAQLPRQRSSIADARGRVRLGPA